MERNLSMALGNGEKDRAQGLWVPQLRSLLSSNLSEVS